MAWFFAHRILLQNLSLSVKNKLASAAPNKGNTTPAVSCASTFIAVLLVISALSFVAQYLKDDFQWIFKTVLDFRPIISPPAPTLAL